MISFAWTDMLSLDFGIAKALIKSPKNKLSLSSETLEDICLSCSRELYDNASSGNYTFGEMKLAYEWYELFASKNFKH